MTKFTKKIGGPFYGSLSRPYATRVMNSQYKTFENRACCRFNPEIFWSNPYLLKSIKYSIQLSNQWHICRLLYFYNIVTKNLYQSSFSKAIQNKLSQFILEHKWNLVQNIIWHSLQDILQLTRKIWTMPFRKWYPLKTKKYSVL